MIRKQKSERLYLKEQPRFNFQIILFLFIASFFLRMIFWSRFPPGLTADEAVMGYDAYNILKTGRDQFGTPWPLAFRSFGDYRPPLYIYATVPFVASLGLTELSTRFPSMIAGALEVVLIYLLGVILFSGTVGWLAAVFLALSPWSLLHTRFAQEANLSTLTITTGVLLCLMWMKNRRIFLLVGSSISFTLSLYSYHNARLTTPLLIVGGVVLLRKLGRLKKKEIVQITIAGLIGFVMLLPILLYLEQFPEAGWRRASAQSVLGAQSIKISLWNDLTARGSNYPIWLARLQYNKPLYYGKAIIKGYLSHFDPRFLFISGDPHERFRTPGSGLVNLALIVALPFGILPFLAGDQRRKFILWWLVVAPVVASLSTIVPNSQHAQDMMIPLHLIIAVGTVNLVRKIGKPGMLLIVGLFCVSLYSFLDGYMRIVPRDTRYLQNWHYYGDVFDKIEKIHPKKVVFLGGQFYINLVFHLQYDPATFQREVVVERPEDLHDFDHVKAFGIYEFRKTKDIPLLEQDTLYVRLSEKGFDPGEDTQVIDRVIWPDAQLEYQLFALNKIG